MSEELEKKPIGFLEEAAGEQSMMRLISLVLTGVGLILCVTASVAGLFGNANTSVMVQMGTTLLATGVGGKLFQKFGEAK